MTLTADIIAAIVKADDEAPVMGQVLDPGETVTFRVAGKQGDRGPQGENGPEGPTGPRGFDGDIGVMGPLGNTGPEGPQGVPGTDGKDGKDGAKGPKGDTGATGSTGPKGDQGDRGPQGPAGSVVMTRRDAGAGGGGGGGGAALSDAVPLVESGAGAAGAAGAASRGDHVHPEGAGAGTQDIEDVLTEGNDAGGQEVLGLGQVTVNPGPANLFGLLIEALAGFDNVYTAFIRVTDEFGNDIFSMDTGGFDQYAVPGQHAHVSLREQDTGNISELSSNSETGLNLGSGTIGPSFAQIAADRGFDMRAFVPATIPNPAHGQIYYDDTTGAPTWRWRGKDAVGADFSGPLGGGLAGSAQTYTESNVTTDRALNANATSIDELADVLGTLIADLRNRGVVN